MSQEVDQIIIEKMEAAYKEFEQQLLRLQKSAQRKLKLSAKKIDNKNIKQAIEEIKTIT